MVFTVQSRPPCWCHVSCLMFSRPFEMFHSVYKQFVHRRHSLCRVLLIVSETWPCRFYVSFYDNHSSKRLAVKNDWRGSDGCWRSLTKRHQCLMTLTCMNEVLVKCNAFHSASKASVQYSFCASLCRLFVGALGFILISFYFQSFWTFLSGFSFLITVISFSCTLLFRPPTCV